MRIIRLIGIFLITFLFFSYQTCRDNKTYSINKDIKEVNKNIHYIKKEYGKIIFKTDNIKVIIEDKKNTLEKLQDKIEQKQELLNDVNLSLQKKEEILSEIYKLLKEREDTLDARIADAKKLAEVSDSLKLSVNEIKEINEKIKDYEDKIANLLNQNPLRIIGVNSKLLNDKGEKPKKFNDIYYYEFSFSKNGCNPSKETLYLIIREADVTGKYINGKTSNRYPRIKMGEESVIPIQSFVAEGNKQKIERINIKNLDLRKGRQYLVYFVNEKGINKYQHPNNQNYDIFNVSADLL